MKNQADDQILKMYNVTRQMKQVFQTLRKNQDIYKLNQQILRLFTQQLDILIQHTKQFLQEDDHSRSSSRTNTIHRRPSSIKSINKHQGDTLTMGKMLRSSSQSLVIAQEIHQSESQLSPFRSKQNFSNLSRKDQSKIQTNQNNQMKTQSHNRANQSCVEIDIIQLVELNNELSQQNDYLTKKIQQLEQKLKIKIEIQNGKHKNIRRIHQQYENKSNRLYNNQNGLEMKEKLDELRECLKEAEEYISINNNEFILQIQDYNEKCWRLQKQIQKKNKELLIFEKNMDQKQTIIQKLREQNFNLQMIIRQINRSNNLKNIKNSNMNYLNNNMKYSKKDKQWQIQDDLMRNMNRYSELSNKKIVLKRDINHKIVQKTSYYNKHNI